MARGHIAEYEPTETERDILRNVARVGRAFNDYAGTRREALARKAELSRLKLAGLLKSYRKTEPHLELTIAGRAALQKGE